MSGEQSEHDPPARSQGPRQRSLWLALLTASAIAGTLSCATVAEAATIGPVTAYESTNHDAYAWNASSGAGEAASIAARTGASPSAGTLVGGGYEIAEQATSGDLTVLSSSGTTTSFSSAVAANTSPSLVVPFSGAGYVVAFQGSNTHVMMATPSSSTATDLGIAMAPGTSPSIAANVHGCCQIAYQGGNGHLFTWASGSSSGNDSGHAMEAGTSPSIAAEPLNHEIAFQGSDTDLETLSASGFTDTGDQMQSGTNPIVVALSTGAYEIAFHGRNGHLWLLSTATGALTDTNQSMIAGASPGLGALAGGGFLAAFVGTNHDLYTYSSSGTVTATGQAVQSGTNPSEAASPPVLNPRGQSLFGVSADGGLQTEPTATMDRDLSDDAATGAKWVRIDINWAQIQAGGATSYAWTSIDSVVKTARADGLNVLGVLIYTPPWAEASHSCTSGDCAPNTGDFATFARVAAAHYAALGVNAYEVWSEENSTAQWLPTPSPSAYAALLKAAYPAIHRADPNATVITGGTSPAPTNGTDYSPVDFLSGLYANGAKGYFDAVGAHPYCWPADPGDPDSWSAWYQMYGASESMRSVMVANGDSAKQIWGTEFGAPTNGPPGSFVTPAQQAAMIADGFALWSSYSWAGPLMVFEGRDQGTTANTSSVFNFLGLLYNNFSPKPGFGAYQQSVSMY